MSDKVRIGIDVGGTFTKAVAIGAKTGTIIAKSTVPTTHRSDRGVSDGIIAVLSDVIQSGIKLDDIELISHSTTQAINALLESDTYTVGIIAMGVGPTKNDVIKRTKLDSSGTNPRQDLKTVHEFLDTSHLITNSEVCGLIEILRKKGAKVIVASEAFGVDDPSNEIFVMNHATKLGLPATSSHEISGIYGLEIRTLTAAVNASVLPKTFQVADFVEDAIRSTGVKSPLMIMKGDGGVTSMDTFRTRPILTVLSGPAASVAGALLHLKITNGIFIEVGGTSTNVCIIKDGRPEIRYVTINDHPTCVRSMDVRIIGVAGGSMITLYKDRVSRVGPRSAHIAGLKYACFAEPEELESGEIIMIRPKPDDEEYVAIKCADNTYGITNTCAANALGMIEEDDYSYADIKAAKIAMSKLGERLGVSYTEAAMSIIQTSSFEITKTVGRILKEFKMDASTSRIIGAGGGASVLAPFVAKQMGMKYQKAEHAEVISSIGVASSMLQEELEITMTEPSPEKISGAHKKIHAMLVKRGAIPESIVTDGKYIAEKSVLRITAVGNVELDSKDSMNVFTLEEARLRASEIIGISPDMTDLSFESDHHMVFAGHITQKRLFTKKDRQHILVLDRFGRPKASVKNGRVFQGGRVSIIKELDGFLESRRSDIAPQIRLINDMRMMDFSGITSASHILDAVRDELDGNERAAIIVEMS